jgi:hypothetical protein
MLSGTADVPARVEELESMAASAGTLEAASIAARALESTGELTASLPAQWGFITQWQELGPLQDFARAYFAETTLRPPAHVVENETTVEWVSAEATGIPAVLELRSEAGTAWYVRGEVVVPKWMTAELRLGSNGPYSLWLNGEPIHMIDEARVLEADDDLVQVVLQPGRNHVLVKLAATDGVARFTARVTDRGGAALNLANQEMPDDGATGVGTRPGALQDTISQDAP